jgi:hypothetical protein
MPDYRAYIVDSEGHIKSFEVITAPDDEQAVRAAQQYVDGCDVEIWELDRKIAVLTKKD